MNKNFYIWIPSLFALALIIGFLLGANLSPKPLPTQRSNSFSFVQDIFRYIENTYVDTVEQRELVDQTLTYILQELDPHSYYISADELAAMNEPLEGNFEGIGVQFHIRKDTVVVVDALEGGPSRKVGIRAGDRIVSVEGEVIAGIGIGNRKVLKLLKGPKGTKVNVGILRPSSGNLDFEITRDKIPIHSVTGAYMMNDTTGYVKVYRFARNTHKEFVTHVMGLLNKGAKEVVIDLRGNGGGYMDAAIDMLDEFFPENELLVYTEGRKSRKKTYYSTPHGHFLNIRPIILIDESSASASEIVAGAIQDQDRGWVVGRRSFGKGLVQEQTQWPNGAATRLTIARYYTPSGRCIQKPYQNGSSDYRQDYFHRYDHGEMFSADSITVDSSEVYYTKNGRKVYGGGGVIPDYFIPVDTTENWTFLNRMINTGLIYDYAFEFSDQHREELMENGGVDAFRDSFNVSEVMMDDLISRAASKNIEIPGEEMVQAKPEIQRRLKAYIARNVWNDEGFYPIWNERDPYIQAIQTTRKNTVTQR
jgi:carboxyl-terminal processing protease